MRRNRQFVLGVLLVPLLLTTLLLLQRAPATPKSRMPNGTSLSSSRTHVSPSHGVLYRVAHVIDGDTIDVFVSDSQTERIRFIGIDTPETVDQRKKIQCYGPEASAKMKELLTGESVVLETKPDEDTDDYGRFLRYVILDGNDIGAKMLEEGYAKSLCVAFPHPKCAEYEALEREAKNKKIGRWGSCR